MKVLKDERTKLPIKMWLDDIEDGALDQAINLSNLPFAFKHIAIMPDSHQGYGMPIGGVLATRGVVIPNAVGVDIGCGMRAARTNLQELDQQTIKEIMGMIRNTIPTGEKHNKVSFESTLFEDAPDLEIIQKQIPSAKRQIGSLGGGNHFIEIQKGSDGFIWIMIHSGSRNLGYQTAKHFHELAVKMCKRWYSDIPNTDLSFLPIDTQEGKDYMEAMNFCLKFAKFSRKIMLERCLNAFASSSTFFNLVDQLDVHHNYAQWENHFNKNVIVHRKGATSARVGEYGIIPGSQESKSYIVLGKGNPESFCSCSHGAGRKMSRTAAIKNLNLEEEIKKMDDKGIIHTVRSKDDLDEAGGAYKDINVVMKNQKDLVDILIELSPIAVIKGKNKKRNMKKKRQK